MNDKPIEVKLSFDKAQEFFKKPLSDDVYKQIREAYMEGYQDARRHGTGASKDKAMGSWERSAVRAVLEGEQH